MKNISEVLTGVKTMGIADTWGRTGTGVGLVWRHLYVTEHFPEIDVRIYLDHPKPVFSHIDRIGDIRTETDGDREFDLFVTCDVKRGTVWLWRTNILTGQKTVCIDHHVSNPGFSDINHVRGMSALLRGPLRTSGCRQSRPSGCGCHLYRHDPRYRSIPVFFHLSGNHENCRRTDENRI